MAKDDLLLEAIGRIEQRLEVMDGRLEHVQRTTRKAMEWMGTLSSHIDSLDAFREEVRGCFEPFFGKLEQYDEVMRILRHATSDVSRRIEALEEEGRRKAG